MSSLNLLKCSYELEFRIGGKLDAHKTFLIASILLIFDLLAACTYSDWTVLRECDGLLSEVWINTVQHSEELIFNIFRRLKGKEGIAIQF